MVPVVLTGNGTLSWYVPLAFLSRPVDRGAIEDSMAAGSCSFSDSRPQPIGWIDRGSDRERPRRAVAAIQPFLVVHPEWSMATALLTLHRHG